MEVDGATHATADELAYDGQRTKYLEREGWAVIRVNNIDVYENMDGVWRMISDALPPPLASLGPPPHAGEEGV